MQMNVEERRSCRRHCIDQRLFDPIAVVESFRVPKIDNQVTARIGQPISRDEMILAVLIP